MLKFKSVTMVIRRKPSKLHKYSQIGFIHNEYKIEFENPNQDQVIKLKQNRNNLLVTWLRGKFKSVTMVISRKIVLEIKLLTVTTRKILI